MLVEYYGLFFDTDTREVLANDGLEVLSQGDFRDFPLVPTKKGLDTFKTLWKKAIGGGFSFETYLGKSNGKTALLVKVGSNGDWLIEDFVFGTVLEMMLRHQSEAVAIEYIKS